MTQRKLFWTSSLTSIALLSALPWAPVQAQTAPAEREAAEVEVVVVTARKRVESLQDTPLSVSALTGQDIQARGLRDISDIALVTPGFSMQNIQAGTEQPFIRGMSSTSFERTLQTSSSFVDGNYFSVLGRTVFFPDIERVEVVRGPQAALFGRATFAGAINYITKSPSRAFGGDLRFSYGDNERARVHASVTGPLVDDKLFYRVSINSETFAGEYRNILDGRLTGAQNHFGVTGALRFTPTDNLTIDLKAFQTAFNDKGQVPHFIQGAETLNCFPNTAGVFTYFCGKLRPDASKVSLNLNLTGGGYQKNDQTRAIMNVDWRLGDYNLTAVTTFALQRGDTFCDCDYSDRVSAGGAFHSNFIGKIENFSQEVRLRSPTDKPIRFLVGGYLFAEDSYSYRANSATIAIPFVEVRTKAVFGSVEFDVGEAVTVSVDGRYQTENQKRSAIPGNPAINVDYEAFLPRVIVEYKPSKDFMLYGSAAKGNQPGQFNTGTNIPVEFVKVDSESLWSYEIGAKTQFLDNRLRLNVAAFEIDWTNQVYRAETVGSDGRIVNILRNLGASGIKGLEVEAAAVPMKGLNLNATLAYIDAEYKNFLSPNSLRVYRNAQAAGYQLPNTPTWQSSFSAAYTRKISDKLDGFVRGDYSYRGRQYVSEVNQAYIGALHLVNLSVGVETEKLRIALRIDNALNSDIPEFATRFTDLNSPALSRFGYLIKLRNSRAAELSLQYKF
jgi:outer membrane receptor protein involved in Fe transport